MFDRGDLVLHCGMVYEVLWCFGRTVFIRCGTWCDSVDVSVLKHYRGVRRGRPEAILGMVPQ